jgi:hypothetical protein
MNTQQTTMQHLLSDDWIVVINEQLELFPDSIGLVVEPEALGAYHAQLGQPCEPHKYYRKLGDVATYERAYSDVTRIWAATVQAVNDEVYAERERHEIENEWIDDVLFSMRGAW